MTINFTQQGHDHQGRPVRLGDRDCDGVVVGYIDQGGQAWASRHERDLAVLAGRYQDAWDDWGRAGRCGEEPSPEDLLQEIDCHPANLRAALRHARERVQLLQQLRRGWPPGISG